MSDQLPQQVSELIERFEKNQQLFIKMKDITPFLFLTFSLGYHNS